LVQLAFQDVGTLEILRRRQVPNTYANNQGQWGIQKGSLYLIQVTIHRVKLMTFHSRFLFIDNWHCIHKAFWDYSLDETSLTIKS
jgi:hypothetical protein